ncbi:MAG: hypothetical protein K2Y01_08550 [Rhabdochlamydiaceae bacterium]|nr:hypothetical protein [Rhabdochlamydiaceae bacterium]
MRSKLNGKTHLISRLCSLCLENHSRITSKVLCELYTLAGYSFLIQAILSRLVSDGFAAIKRVSYLSKEIKFCLRYLLSKDFARRKRVFARIQIQVER